MEFFIFLLVILLLVWFFSLSSSKSDQAKTVMQKKIALQNYVSTPSSNLVLTDKELTRAANSYLNKCRKSMERCLEGMQKATTPKAYFAKLNDYEEIKKDITGLQSVWMGEFSVRFPTEADITRLTNEMIDRYWFSCEEKSINLVSDKGKRHALQTFFDTLNLYGAYLNQDNLNRIDKYRDEFISMFLLNTIE